MATNTDTTPAAAGEGAPVALPYGVMLRLEDSLYEVQEAVAILDRLLTYSVLDTGADCASVAAVRKMYPALSESTILIPTEDEMTALTGALSILRRRFDAMKEFALGEIWDAWKVARRTLEEKA